MAISHRAQFDFSCRKQESQPDILGSADELSAGKNRHMKIVMLEGPNRFTIEFDRKEHKKNKPCRESAEGENWPNGVSPMATLTGWNWSADSRGGRFRR